MVTMLESATIKLRSERIFVQFGEYFSKLCGISLGKNEKRA